MAETKLDEARQEILRGIVASFAKDAAFQDVVALAFRDGKAPASTRVLILESMARAQLEKLPATWLAEARWSLESPDERIVRQAVATLKATGSGEFDDALVRLGRDEERSIELRTEALAAAAPRLAKLEGGLYKFLLGCLEKDRAPLTRLAAAEAIGRATLDDPQLDSLTRALSAAGPLEMPRLISAFERSKSASVGKKLVASLDKSPGLTSLSAEALVKAFKGFPDEVKSAGQPLLKKLEVDSEGMKAKLDELAPVLKGGEPSRGRDVFYGKKAGCTACHTIAGMGGKVGPDLSKIGSIRSGRDLLEAIVFPSATFARGFEPFLIRTKDGAVYDGLIVRETAESVVLFTAADRVEKRIPRASVDEIRQSKISVMPQGLDAQLSRDELRDLIAFLTSLR
jgi:putative heme-binding domain-containing protein